jgi:FkbM family methyltransferase
MRVSFASTEEVAEAYYSNAYGKMERVILDRVISAGSTVVDVGANIGFYTCLFAKKVGPVGRVIAVEPTPSSYAVLRQNVLVNNLGEIVECWPYALSDHDGTARLHLFREGEAGFNSLGATRSYDGRTSVGSVDVATTTLDSLLADHPPEREYFVKIDVEGFEYQVLMGGRHCLRSLPKIALMVELYEPAAQQCGSSIAASISMLASCGLRAFQTTQRPGELVPLEDGFAGRPIRRGFFPDVFFFKQPPSHF